MSGPQEAADAALDVKAKIAIPFHYGMYEGSAEDAYTFKELLKGKIKVIIKERESYHSLLAFRAGLVLSLTRMWHSCISPG